MWFKFDKLIRYVNYTTHTRQKSSNADVRLKNALRVDR